MNRVANIMQIKSLDGTIERSRIIDVWKQMWCYLNPEETELTEEEFDAIFARDDQTLLSRDFLRQKIIKGT
jgi:hypothetical protein